VLSAGLGSKGVTVASPTGVDLPRSPQVPAATVQIAPQVAPRPTEAEKATRQLSEAVSGLTADRDRLVARIASIERNLEDVTGSIKQQAASAPVSNPAVPPTMAPAPAATAPAPTRSQSQPEPAAPQAAPAPAPGAIAAPPSPPAARVASVAAIQEPEPAKSEPAKSEPAKSRIVDFAVDIGGATTFEGLRALWNSVRGATADLFDDLHPMVAARESKARGVDLRLIVGPIASTEAATQMCATLLAARRYCQMTIFEGQPLTQTAPMAESERRPAAPARTTSSSSGQTKSVRPPAPPRP
jgi:hypothetical protein